ncbi:OmpA family protein [Pontibacter diazotrophicus]|uniref:OmpA family protein n=1 Tax=Pontibacter diazotrophicus TaxID=1400979 RepID=A0A3D8L7W7_9BACT|nr:OmpA family protein [Pontibacter diazotrophicus]RDV13072.1 OmpA family protein [Pontibacter diazotrophicus]
MSTRIMTLLLAAGLLASCSETNQEVEDTGDVQELASEDTAVMYEDMAARERLTADGLEVKDMGEGFWTGVDVNAPVVENPRITDTDVETRRGQGYDLYTMDERVLFDLDKAQLREGAEDKLRSVAESINEVSPSGPIRIYGHTDSLASASYNEQLAAERANTVRDWFANNTDIDPARMTTHAVGEEQPRATNETARGRQLNRRVAIAVATGDEAQATPAQQQQQMQPQQP